MRTSFPVLCLVGLASCTPAEPPHPVQGSAQALWTTTPGAMATARFGFSTTLLPNGRVLVAGGQNDAGAAEASAELFDPETLRFSGLPAMATARWAHTATMLHDGRVLLVGGGTPQAEFFTTLADGGGQFSSAGTMGFVRSWHTATLLDDGRVLVVGGETDGHQCELFAPDAGFRPCAPTSERHTPGAASLITTPGGARQVMLIGGTRADGGGNVAEFYDSDNDQWLIGFGRFGQGDTQYPTLHQVSDGGVLILGGRGQNQTSSGWYANGVATYSLTATAPFVIPAPWRTRDFQQMYRGQTILGPRGRIVRITGGSEDNNCFIFTNASVSELDLSATPIDLLLTPLPTPSDEEREWEGAVLLPSGNFLAAGGVKRRGSCVPNTNPWASAWFFDWMQGRDTFTSLAPLPVARAHHTMTLLRDGRVLLAGGDGAGAISTVLLDGALNPLPGPPLAAPRRAHTATTLSDGRVLLVGGTDGVEPIASAVLFDPASNFIADAGALLVARTGHAATLLPDGRVLISGGEGAPADGGLPLASGEVYDPATGAFTLVPTLLPAPRYGHSVVTLPDGRLFVIGGRQRATAPLGGVYLDPATLISAPAAGAMASAHAFAAVAVVGGRVFVAGGESVSGPVSSADVLELATGTWSSVALGTSRQGAHVTRLLNDRLLVVGGAAQSVDLLDPARLLRLGTPPPAGIHDFGASVLLPDGRVAISGGVGFPSSLETYDEGRLTDPLLRPSLTPPLALVAGQRAVLTGTRLTGLVEGSGGGTLSSATNFPFVTLELPSGRRASLLARAWTPTSVEVEVPAELIGQGWLRVTVSAVPSIALPVRVLRAEGARCALGSDCVSGLACTGMPSTCTPSPDAGTGGGGGATGGGGGATGGGGGATGGGGGATGGGGGGGSATGGGGGGSATGGGGGATGGGDATTGGGEGAGGGSQADGGIEPVADLMSCGCSSGVGGASSLVLCVALLVFRRRGARVAAVLALGLALPSVSQAEEPERIAVLGLRPLAGMKPDVARVVTNQLSNAIQARGFRVITPDDIETLLGVERQRQLAGCSETACTAEIGQALGSRRMVSGTLASIGNSAVIDLALFDTGKGMVETRFSQRVRNANEESFLDIIPAAVDALFPPKAAVELRDEAKPSAASGPRRLGIDLRGQLATEGLGTSLHGNFGALVTFRVLSWLELGAAALISRTPGGAVHAGVIIGNDTWPVQPLLALEVPMLAAGTLAVGLTGAVGAEWRPIPLLAVRAEVPVTYFFIPRAQANLFVMGSLSVGVRI